MSMDIVLGLIFIFTLFLAMRRGFAITIANFFKGFVTLGIGWAFKDELGTYLMEKTALGPYALSKVHSQMTMELKNSLLYRALPSILKTTTEDGSTFFVEDGAETVARLLISVLAFIIIVVGLRLVLSLFIMAFSKKKNKGFPGFVDWVLGSVLGIILGALSVLLFLAALPVVVALFMPEKAEAIMGTFEGSYFAEDLYDNNLLLILFRDFVG